MAIERDPGSRRWTNTLCSTGDVVGHEPCAAVHAESNDQGSLLRHPAHDPFSFDRLSDAVDLFEHHVCLLVQFRN